jgi:hypothetical protein
MSEYVILITIVVAFMASMFTYVKRGTQSLVKVATDQIGSQIKSEQDFGGLGGYINASNTTSEMTANYQIDVWPNAAAWQKVFYEKTDSQTNTVSNLGFTEM